MHTKQTKQQPNTENLLESLTKTTKCVCVEDYRRLAEKVLPVETFHYIDAGADEQITANRNVKAFQNILLFPRVLRDAHGLDLRVKLFGRECSMPLGFAPWAMNKITNKQLGQKGPSKMAAKYKLPYILSTLSNTHPKQITEINPDGLKFLQIYLCQNWDLNLHIIKIAQQSKFDGLCITVDAQVLGTRRKQQMYHLDSSKYEFPILQQITGKSTQGPKQRKSYLKNRDLSLSWKTIQKIRKLTSLKIILKGILHPSDAVTAKNYCDAIYISNHGGRQLDTVPATIQVLPNIVSAVRQHNKQIPILIDGGIRTGNDIFKCLALGANFVFIGRPVAYSLIKGQQGIQQMINMFKDQLVRCMILNGTNNIQSVTSQYIGYRSKL